MTKPARLRITITLPAPIVLRLDARARKSKRSRTEAAAEIIAEVLRAQWLEPDDLTPQLLAAANADRAERRKLARLITGPKPAETATQSHAEGLEAPGGGSARTARHWGSKARQRPSGAKGGGSAAPKRGAELPAIILKRTG